MGRRRFYSHCYRDPLEADEQSRSDDPTDGRSPDLLRRDHVSGLRHKKLVPTSGRSVDDEAVTAVVLTDEAAGNVQRFQLQTEPAHVDAQLFGLVFARPPAEANDLAGAEEAV